MKPRNHSNRLIPATIWLLVGFALNAHCQNQGNNIPKQPESGPGEDVSIEDRSIFRNGCRPPPRLDNGYFYNCIDEAPIVKSTGEYSYHTVLIPKCSNGTKLFNQPFIKCAENGEWEGNPECRACCPLPRLTHEMGVYYFTDTREWIDEFMAECLEPAEQHSISVACYQDYDARPKHGTIKCTADGKIENHDDVPSCQQPTTTPDDGCLGCRVPEPFSEGGLIYHNEKIASEDGRCFPTESYLFADCKRRHAPTRPMIKCLGNNEWEGRLTLACEYDPRYRRPEMCVPPKPIENGYYSILGSDAEYDVANIPPGTTFAINCNAGYKLEGGQESIVCERNRSLGARRFAFDDLHAKCIQRTGRTAEPPPPPPECCRIDFDEFPNGYFRRVATNRTLNINRDSCLYNGTVLHVRCNPPYYLEGNDGQIECIDDEFQYAGDCRLPTDGKGGGVKYQYDITAAVIVGILIAAIVVYLLIFLPIYCVLHQNPFCTC